MLKIGYGLLAFVLVGCTHHPVTTAQPNPVASQPNPGASVSSRNEKMYFIWRCLNERGFQGRHFKSCEVAIRSLDK